MYVEYIFTTRVYSFMCECRSTDTTANVWRSEDSHLGGHSLCSALRLGQRVFLKLSAACAKQAGPAVSGVCCLCFSSFYRDAGIVEASWHNLVLCGSLVFRFRSYTCTTSMSTHQISSHLLKHAISQVWWLAPWSQDVGGRGRKISDFLPSLVYIISCSQS